MTRLDEIEAQILEDARRGLGPTLQDQERVLQNLLVRTSATPGTPLSPSNGARSKSAAWLLRAGWSMFVMGAIALSGGLGYRRGFEAGIATQKSANFGATGSGSKSPELAIQTAPASPPAPTSPRASASPPAPTPSSELARRITVGPDHTRVSLPLGTGTTDTALAAPDARPSRDPAVATEKLGLDEEVRQLRRVERAIRESNPRFALVLLEELEQAIPTGQLLEEREAARIMASCQLDADNALADARSFITKHGASAYRSRVIEICRLTSTPAERILAEPGTDAPETENQP